jgi:hypothetical protein
MVCNLVINQAVKKKNDTHEWWKEQNKWKINMIQ